MKLTADSLELKVNVIDVPIFKPPGHFDSGWTHSTLSSGPEESQLHSVADMLRYVEEAKKRKERLELAIESMMTEVNRVLEQGESDGTFPSSRPRSCPSCSKHLERTVNQPDKTVVDKDLMVYGCECGWRQNRVEIENRIKLNTYLREIQPKLYTKTSRFLTSDLEQRRNETRWDWAVRLTKELMKRTALKEAA
jgi:hypothetical protein